MLKLNVNNETSTLKAVLLGTAVSNGPTPSVEECYDPKSKAHVLQGTYPLEKNMVTEMEYLATVFKKHQVTVYRPDVIENCNQIFSRDIAFVIEDKLIRANILPNREAEVAAIQYIWQQVDPQKQIVLPQNCHVEGGDVILYNDYIFVGVYTKPDYSQQITARTNMHAVHALQSLFPNKKIKTFELRKSNSDPFENALHLDCCFQPIGKGKAIIHKNGFLNAAEYQWLIQFFGIENVIEISKQEMYEMQCNVFSISEDIIVSEKNFTRLNTWLRTKGFSVEEVAYSEIAKQEGLLRCSTLPLIRV